MKDSSLFLIMLAVSIVTTCNAIPELIDLSHKIDFDTLPSFPISPLYNLTNRAVVFAVNGTVRLETNIYSTMEHSSTHIDAPIHAKLTADENAETIDEIPLENTVAYGVMIDCVREAEADASYIVPLQKIFEWERVYGKIPRGAAVLFNFGYSRYFVDNQQRYRGTADLGDAVSYVFPTVSLEAALFLVNFRDLKILGTDTLSPESLFIDGELAEFPIHVMLLSRDRLIVENLNNLSALPPRGFLFHAAPAKFIGASGMQVRAYAALTDEGQYRAQQPRYVPQRIFAARPSYYEPRGFRYRN